MSIFTSDDGVDIGYNYGRKPTTTTAFITATIKVQVAVSDLSDIEKLTEQDVKDAIEDECTLDYEMVDWEVDSTEEEEYDPEPDYD